jgi:hypothetical protein
MSCGENKTKIFLIWGKTNRKGWGGTRGGGWGFGGWSGTLWGAIEPPMGPPGHPPQMGLKITLVLTQIQQTNCVVVYNKKNADFNKMYRNLNMYVFEKVNKKLFQSINLISAFDVFSCWIRCSWALLSHTIFALEGFKRYLHYIML